MIKINKLQKLFPRFSNKDKNFASQNKMKRGIDRLVSVEEHGVFGSESYPAIRSDLVNIDKDNITEYTQLLKFEYLLLLSDDLIGHILFAGYLSRSWYQIVLLLLVCKRIQNIGKTYIAYIDHKSRDWHDSVTATAMNNLFSISSIANNLVYLDLSYCNITINTPETIDIFKKWKGTLQGLNLRGTSVCDKFLTDVQLSEFNQLKFLDVSKLNVQDASLITDIGGFQIAKIPQLKWLNISSTSVTDETVEKLSINCQTIWHLGLQCCLGFTNDGVKYLRNMGSLRILDISGCPRLTKPGVDILLNFDQEYSTRKFPLQNSLTTLSISFLPDALPRGPIISNLISKYDKLLRLEMRKRVDDEIAEEVITEARKKLEIGIFSHSDQLRLIKEQSIIETIPSLVDLCPIFRWPYYHSGL